MDSFLFRENSWTHAKHNGGKDDCFGEKLKECNSIIDVLQMYWTINCSRDFNEFIHRALDSSLKGNSRKRPFRSIRTFQASTKLEENIFPFNYNSNESQLYCNHNNKSSILICFSGKPPSHQILDIRFGLPLLVFHAKYSQLFGSIAYIQEKDYGDQSALIEKLKKILELTKASRIVLFGFCFGAHLPIILQNKLNAFESISFSPTFSTVFKKDDFEKLNLSSQHYLNSPLTKRMKIYYSGEDKLVHEFIEYCKSKTSKRAFKSFFHNLSGISPSHNTIETLFDEKILDQIMQNFLFN